MHTLTRRIVMACAAIAMIMGSLSANAITLYGFARNYATPGFVTIDTDNPASATRIASDIVPIAGAIKDSTLYIMSFDDDFNTQLYSVDIPTGATTLIGTKPEGVGFPNDMSFNYVDNKMYFICNSANENVSTSMLGAIDLTTGALSTVIADLGFYARAMTIGVDGTMYYMTRDGVLCSYNLTSHESTTIGNTGIKPRQTFGSLGMDRNNGMLYWASETSTSYVNHLYRVDPTNAATTDLGVIGSGNNGEGFWTVGLDAPYVMADLTAPQRVSNLTATPDPQGALSVVLNWTNPTLMMNGETLESIDKVKITRGSEQVGEVLNAVPGNASTFTDVVPAAGTYRYHVQACNAAGTGADQFVDVYVGADVLAAPANATATLDMTRLCSTVITWNAPTTGAHGGYAPTQNVTYNVMRNGETLATGLTSCTYTDSNMATLARYTYQIVAVNSAGAGEAAETNFLVNGPARNINPTMTADFNGEAEALLWTPLDANTDGYTFEWHRYSMLGRNFYIYQAHPSYYALDWLVSPPLKFVEGHEYEITVSAANTLQPYPERFNVYSMIGYTTAAAMPLSDEVEINHPNELRDYTFTITAEEDGNGVENEEFVSFIGVQCCSNYGMQMLLVGDVRIIDKTPAATLRGDVNGDGEVDVRDITALIDVIMNSITNNQRADVNGDSEIDVRDITALIDIIMNA